MKIQDLIIKLQSMNPNSDVLIEDLEEFREFEITQGDDYGDQAIVIISPV